MTYDIKEEVRLDFDRARRAGLDETIYAQGKSAAQLELILETADARGAPLLITRLPHEKFAALSKRWSSRLDYCTASNTAFFGRGACPMPGPARIAIVAAGSSDAPVAREAQRTLAYNRIASAAFLDVGVAGLWRLAGCLEALREFPVIIAVAGMDAALPTVLGGLVASVIIAVPTSVGYGVAAGGHAALNAILASCAPGITTVNIDNGYGAACAALRVLRSSCSAFGPPGRREVAPAAMPA